MTPEMMMAFSIAIGGFLGAIGRFWVSRGLFSGYPLLGTLMVNLLGSFLVVIILKSELGNSAYFRAGAAIGFCGSFTTFSTFMIEVFRLLQSGRWSWASLYVILTMGGSLGAIFLALKLCHHLA